MRPGTLLRAAGLALGLLACSTSLPDTLLVPVPFDATTSYRRGTSDGPEAILAASRQVDLHDHETGRPYEAGIHMLAIPDAIARPSSMRRPASATAAPARASMRAKSRPNPPKAPVTSATLPSSLICMDRSLASDRPNQGQTPLSPKSGSDPTFPPFREIRV